MTRFSGSDRPFRKAKVAGIDHGATKEKSMTDKAIATTTTRGNRIYWLDNLRTFLKFLVILLHAGIVYESSGISAFISWIVVDPSTNDLSGILSFVILDIFVMATLFLVAGFFYACIREKEGRVGLCSIEIQKTHNSLDYRCLDPNPAL
jgi:hypothetical protein